MLAPYDLPCNDIIETRNTKITQTAIRYSCEGYVVEIRIHDKIDGWTVKFLREDGTLLKFYLEDDKK